MNLLYILKRFVPKYRWNVFFNVLFNFLATLFSLISFAAIIPILRIIFGLNTEQVAFQPYEDSMSFKEWTDALSNNFYYLMQTMIEEHGALYVLVAVGCVLIVFAGLKVFSSFFAMFFWCQFVRVWCGIYGCNCLKRLSICPLVTLRRRKRAM